MRSGRGRGKMGNEKRTEKDKGEEKDKREGEGGEEDLQAPSGPS